MRPGLPGRRRTGVALLAATLGISGVVVASPQAALEAAAEGEAVAAGSLEELVVVESDTTTGPFGAVSLVTVNSDGSPSAKNVVPLPTDARAENLALTLDTREANAGHLARSADGRYLTIAGWANEPGTNSSNDHSVGRIDALGNVDTSTSLGSSFYREFPNGVVSPDGETFFVSGEGEESNDNCGIVRVALGGNDPEPWTSTLMRSASASRIIDGDLYVATMRVYPYGLAKIGEGIPAAPAEHVSVFGSDVESNFGSDMGSFALLDLDPEVPGIDTAYVTDHGIQKLSFDGTAWTSQGLPRQLGDINAFTARVVDGQAEIFLVRGTQAGNSLVRVVDTAASDAPPAYSGEQVLKTAEGTKVLRGIDFAPTDWNPEPAPTPAANELAVVEVNGAGNTAGSVAIQRYGVKDNVWRGQIQLPAVAADGKPAFTLPAGQTASGALKRSADGRYLTVVGNGAPVGPRAASPSVIGRIDAAAAADLSTVVADAYQAANGNPYSVVSNDGTGYWTIGQGGGAGLRYIEHGASTSTQINTAGLPGLSIANGTLYAGGNPFGGGSTVYAYDPPLPTAPTNTARETIPNTDYQSGFVVLDLDEAVEGPDTIYVGARNGLMKFTSNGTAWTSLGLYASPQVAHLTAQPVLGGVELYGTTIDGQQLLKLVDTADWNAAPAIANTVTMATANPGTVLRGVAFPPNGAFGAPTGPQLPGRPSLRLSSTQVVGTALNPRNPTLGITLADRDTPAGELTVSATSSNTNVLPVEGITFSGTGASRRAFFAPIASGSSTVTITVTDPQGNSTSTTTSYNAEPAVDDTSIFFYYGVDDISSAVDVGGGYLLGVTDEENSPRLYKRQTPTDVVGGGSAVKTFNIPGIAGGENDYEGMARAGDLIYLFASHGNDKGGGSEPDRAVFDVVRITGTGLNIELTRVGGTTTLKSQLHAWDAGNGHGLGADYLGFVAGSRPGVIPNPPNGFNIEGVEFAPGSSSTIYLAWRAPTVVRDGVPHALIVPVTNIDTFMTGEEPQAEFGAPIFLDLGGRSIRDIRKNADDHYLISAGPGNDATSWALYSWDGNPESKPVLDQLLPAENVAGTWETIPSVPTPMVSGAQVELLTDAGDADGNQRSFGKIFTLTGGPRPGYLTVQVMPAGTAAKVTVDGVVRDAGGVDGLALPDGEHEVCVIAPTNYIAPDCKTVTVTAQAGADVVLDLIPMTRIVGVWNANEIDNAPVTMTVDGVPVNDGTSGELDFRVTPGTHVFCWSAVAGFTPPACQTQTFAPSPYGYQMYGTYTANPEGDGYTGPTGMLRVAQTGNPLPTSVIVDGKIRATWGLDWMRIAPGQHEVCFTEIPGYLTPGCQTVTVTGVRTTTVEVAFTPAAVLRVSTNAPGPAQIFVDGVALDGWGVWTHLPAGEVEVSFGDVPGHTTPAPQMVTLTAGETATVTGGYAPAP